MVAVVRSEHMTTFRSVLMVLAVLGVSVSSAFAQSATVSGVVADETGGVLPGVSVTLQPAGAQTPLETVTDGAGPLSLRQRAGRARRSSRSA